MENKIGSERNDFAVWAVDVRKIYETEIRTVEALIDITLKVPSGTVSAISGPSGSGKTTLLNIIGGIDKPSSGTITVMGEELITKDEDFLTEFRCKNVGFVFQSYNLISTLTVYENVAFPMEWIRTPPENIRQRTNELLESVGLKDRIEHFPFQLSGGEQQRAALARAMANNPPLLLADEPTGNLDKKASARIVHLLQRLKEGGKTIIVATHDECIIEIADLRFHLENGVLTCSNE